MMTNADCTLYKYDGATGGFIRHFISGVYWRENKTGNVLKGGLQTSDSTTVYLYSDNVVPSTPTRDMLVKGNCDYTFNNTSEQTISQSLNQFRKSYNFVTVMSVENDMFGGLPHIEISAK